MESEPYRYAIHQLLGERVVVSHPFNGRHVMISRQDAERLPGNADVIGGDAFTNLKDAGLLVESSENRLPADVVVFGYGMHPLLDSSPVARALMTASDGFYYIDEDWRAPILRMLNPKAVSLARHFDNGTRNDAFASMVREIIDHALEGGDTLLGLYGNPMMGSLITRMLCRGCDAHGLSHKIIPGSSFLDPVWCSLEIDPMHGFSMRTPDIGMEGLSPHHHAVLTAIGYDLDDSQRYDHLKKITASLRAVYPENHPAVILTNEGGISREFKIEIAHLPLYHSRIRPGNTSIYLPPVESPR